MGNRKSPVTDASLSHSPSAPKNKRDGEQNEEHDEQDFRDSGRGSGNASEAQYGGHESNDEKENGKSKHDGFEG